MSLMIAAPQTSIAAAANLAGTSSAPGEVSAAGAFPTVEARPADEASASFGAVAGDYPANTSPPLTGQQHPPATIGAPARALMGQGCRAIKL